MTPAYGEMMERGRRNLSAYTAFLRKIRKDRRIQLDSLFSDADDYAFNLVDCTCCGRCCTGLGPRLKDRDIVRMSKTQRIKTAVFMEEYLIADEDGDTIFKKMPCVFFGPDGLCLIYESRPDACRDYPHMDSGRQKNRVSLHIKNLSHCPTVILAVEYLMERLD